MRARAIQRRLHSALTSDGAVVGLLGAGFVVLTLAAQHPDRNFTRPRQHDTFNLLPNWQFFAPNPSQHDLWVIYRTLDDQGRTSPWHDVDLVPPRHFKHLVWFADRRAGKAIIDVAQETLTLVELGQETLEKSNGFELLDRFVRRRVLKDQGVSRIQGYQFAVSRMAGYDESEPPEILYSSSYRELRPEVDTSAQDPAQP